MNMGVLTFCRPGAPVRVLGRLCCSHLARCRGGSRRRAWRCRAVVPNGGVTSGILDDRSVGRILAQVAIAFGISASLFQIPSVGAQVLQSEKGSICIENYPLRTQPSQPFVGRGRGAAGCRAARLNPEADNGSDGNSSQRYYR